MRRQGYSFLLLVIRGARYPRKAVIGLILIARTVGIRQAKVEANASTIRTNPTVTGS
jgi:hypothetical protein